MFIFRIVCAATLKIYLCVFFFLWCCFALLSFESHFNWSNELYGHPWYCRTIFYTYVLFTYWPMSLSIGHWPLSIYVFQFIRKSSDFRLRFVYTNQNVLLKLIKHHNALFYTDLVCAHCSIAAEKKKNKKMLAYARCTLYNELNVSWIAFESKMILSITLPRFICRMYVWNNIEIWPIYTSYYFCVDSIYFIDPQSAYALSIQLHTCLVVCNINFGQSMNLCRIRCMRLVSFKVDDINSAVRLQISMQMYVLVHLCIS